MNIFLSIIVNNLNICQFGIIQQCANVMQNNKLLEGETRRFYVNLFLKHARNKNSQGHINSRLMIKVFKRMN